MYRGLDHGEELAEPPADFRIVAGNTTRDYDNPEDPSHFAVSYACYGYSEAEARTSISIVAIVHLLNAQPGRSKAACCSVLTCRLQR